MYVLTLILACVPYNPTEDGPTPPAAIGTEGGTVELAGVTLDIPAGALDAPVEISIVDTGALPPAPFEALSNVFDFEPDGLTFDEPVTVTIPYDDSTPFTRMFWSNDDGGFDEIPATFEDGLATASISHFSSGFVVITPPEEVETAEPYPPADVLFVVDNSCSMFEEQQTLSDNAVAMFDAFATTGLDYHIGVVSTDMENVAQSGRLRRVGADSFVQPSTAQGQSVFSLMVNMGTSGWYEEKGREAAYTMLELIPDVPRNEGFLREHATLDIIFLSDEEDQSGGSVVSLDEFEDWMANKKASPDQLAAHAIVGLPGPGCFDVDTPGTQYLSAVDATGGEAIDLCDDDWSPGLQAIADARLAAANIVLTQVPGEILEVVFDDTHGVPRVTLAEDEYTLDGSTVYFDQGVLPLADDTVRVRYRPL